MEQEKESQFRPSKKGTESIVAGWTSPLTRMKKEGKEEKNSAKKKGNPLIAINSGKARKEGFNCDQTMWISHQRAWSEEGKEGISGERCAGGEKVINAVWPSSKHVTRKEIKNFGKKERRESLAAWERKLVARKKETRGEIGNKG